MINPNGKELYLAVNSCKCTNRGGVSESNFLLTVSVWRARSTLGICMEKDRWCKYTITDFTARYWVFVESYVPKSVPTMKQVIFHLITPGLVSVWRSVLKGQGTSCSCTWPLIWGGSVLSAVLPDRLNFKQQLSHEPLMRKRGYVDG